MKLNRQTCLKICRLFSVAAENDIPSDIQNLSVSKPSPTNSLATFTFKRKKYSLLVDSDIHDDISKINEALRSTTAGTHSQPLENPLLPGSYSVPFEGKDCYIIPKDEKMRLDVFLSRSQPSYSRASWQKIIRGKHVTVNGAVVSTPKILVDDSDSINFDLPHSTEKVETAIPIVYIDEDVIVVDKPIGMLTHKKNPLDTEYTVADFFRKYTTCGIDTDRPGVVHRLDRDTSGLLIGARNETACEKLKQQFADRTVNKTYVAITTGIPSSSELNIDLPIARNSTKPGEFTVDKSGKSAQTHIKVLETSEDYALVELRPKTGRTHQLRVHMTAIHTPILGDRLYGSPADRLYLHAAELDIELPSGKRMTFTSPIPSSFKQALNTKTK